MLHVSHLLTIDPALGRLDYESLSDQALMEMLITFLDNEYKQPFQDKSSNFIDVCEWQYTDKWNVPRDIECEDDRVKAVNFFHLIFQKEQFPFQFIPPLTGHFVVSSCKAYGTLDTSLLPSRLTIFSVSENLLYGAINWGALPRTLAELDLSYNEFCGSCLLQDLPGGMTLLDASSNKLSGELSLNSIPAEMVELCLQKNDLCGSICFGHLPSPMNTLDLSYNAFSGDVRLPKLPPEIVEIGLLRNDLSGTFMIPKTIAPPVEVLCECITAVFDESGQRHEWEDYLLEHAEDCEVNVQEEENQVYSPIDD